MITNLYDLYIHEIQDLHSAETQILEALPKMAARASSDELRDSFTKHLEETREQLNRIKKILGNHNERPEDEECEATRGLLEEGQNLMNEMAGDVTDAGLITAAQRVEHYEIAAYGTAKAHAKLLDFDNDIKLLDETLDEESDANESLTKLATGGFFSSGANREAVAA